MARFWIKDNWRAVGSLNVRTSFSTSRRKVREAVAGVPEASAVTVTVDRGVMVSGVPTT
jgi:hypothetical protein